MQSEPSQFGALTAARARRAAAGFTFGCARRKSSDAPTAHVLDEAFAAYTRIDTGLAANESPGSLQSTARELIADIAGQMAALDKQRRQLVDLLERVEPRATV
jgi:hypothetical protein